MKIDFKEFNEILGRIDNGYHEAALKLGLSDSELDILYVLAAHDHMCLQSTLYKETWMTRSTVNSAIKKNGAGRISVSDSRRREKYLCTCN